MCTPGHGGSVTVMVFLSGITQRRFERVHIDVLDTPPGSHKSAVCAHRVVPICSKRDVHAREFDKGFHACNAY